jgi:hypothetical protein
MATSFFDEAAFSKNSSWDVTPTSSNTYNSANDKSSDASSRIRSLMYPLSGGNSHFVRFFINITEEAKLVKNGSVATTGYVDYSEQDRAFKNTTSGDAITAGASIATGIATAGLGIGSSIAKGGASAVKSIFKSKGSVGSGSAGLLGTLGTVAAGIGGGAAVSASGASETVIDTFKLTQRLKRLAAGITLYTPSGIRANYNFSYSTPDDLLVHLAQQENYDAIAKGIKAMASPLTGLMDGPSGFMDDMKTAKSAGASAIGSVGRIMAATNQTASMLSRTATNKKRDIMFQHVGNRVFSFQYTFAPKSADEAKEVDDIIFMFKYFAHPEMLEGYGSFLYLYPAEFDIEYGMVDAEFTEMQNPYINKISSCVLTAIDVDYTPNNSFQTLENGEPPVITMALQFQEIETLHRDRIAKGF